jgi:hypothetical protein
MNTVEVVDTAITIAEFSRITGYSRGTIDNYIEGNKLPYESVKEYMRGRKHYKLSRQLAEDVKLHGWDKALDMYMNRE